MTSIGIQKRCFHKLKLKLVAVRLAVLSMQLVLLLESWFTNLRDGFEAFLLSLI